jgi:hypothetical protein
MGDLYRRLLRIILICIGSYFSLSITIKNEKSDIFKAVLLIAVVFMIVDNYLPRVHLYTDINSG